MKSACVLAFLAMALSACSEPLEFADWTIPVPEGTRIIEYEGVPIDQRSGEPIRMVRDLEIGRDTEDPNYSFYRPAGVAVDDEGRMYVPNRGTSQVLVYDADGRFVRSFGNKGQGPGEFGGMYGATFAVGTITVEDGGNGRLSVWDTLGNYIDDVPAFDRTLGDLQALDDGSYVGAYAVFFRDGPTRRSTQFVAQVSPSGEQIARITELPRFETSGGIVVPNPYPRFVATRDGAVYVTPTLEYELFSFSLSGRMKWALRATWERTPITQEIIDGVQAYRDTLPEAEREVEWPETMPALRTVLVDGHGHIYLVPYVYYNESLMLGALRPIWADLGPIPEPAELLPVDVYSSEGELLFSGMMESGGRHSLWWTAVRGDHVYRMITEYESGERILERLRLVEPFE